MISGMRSAIQRSAVWRRRSATTTIPAVRKPATGVDGVEALGDASTTDGRVYKSPWRENRIYRQ